ncbi:MAG: hypothetical protein CYG60_16290 [Actinobacteria bacterium]|nr:MAG: hypothetical protein CYG60_16290 [Actinomycetota bacterium]
MGSIEKRLEQLEERAGAAAQDEEERVSREALSRVSTEDLRSVAEYLRRVEDEGGEPTEEEEAALRRYEELREEVRNGR